MEYLGEHFSRKVYWWNFSETNYDDLPDSNWVCFAIEERLPNEGIFERFAKATIKKIFLSSKLLAKTPHIWIHGLIVL